MRPAWAPAMAALLRERARIDLEIADLLTSSSDAANGSPEARVWTSVELPPDCRSRERFARVCREIDGARRNGAIWVVDREAWRAHRERRRGAPKRTPAEPATAVPAPAPTDAETAHSHGLRVVK